MKKVISYKKEIDEAIDELIDCSENDAKEFCSGVQEFGRRTNKITYKQCKYIGKLYKKHINNNYYIHHDWWHNS